MRLPQAVNTSLVMLCLNLVSSSYDDQLIPTSFRRLVEIGAILIIGRSSMAITQKVIRPASIMQLPQAVNMSLVMLCLNLASSSYDDRRIPASFRRLVDMGGNADYQPRFFAALHGPDLYVAIRGSVEITDFNAVLDFNPAPFLESHHAHSGALKCADWVLEQCDAIISNCTGTVVFTGHSIGGTIASLCAARLRLDKGNSNVYATCFATLPAVSEGLGKLLRPFVTTFVVNQDIIPSLNPGNFRAVFQVFLTPPGKDGLKTPDLGGIVEKFAESLIIKDSGTPKTEAVMREIRLHSAKLGARLLVNLGLMGKAGKVINPGVVYHVIITDGVPDVQFFDENVPLENIFEIFSGLKDHFIGTYRKVLGSCMRTKFPDPKLINL
jgi:hypothetical protein